MRSMLTILVLRLSRYNILCT